MLSWRRAAMKVELCQWPCGMALRQRWPMGQRPCSRASLVFKPVSSINTSRRTSQSGCRWRQSFRAALTSGRSCSAARVVFFITQPQLFQAVPQSGDADGHVQPLETPSLEFAQGQIRLPRDPTAQGAVMLFQTGATITTDLLGSACAGQPVLLPKPFDAFAADAKPLANLAGALATLPRGDDPLTQILAQRPHTFPSMEKVCPQTTSASI